MGESDRMSSFSDNGDEVNKYPSPFKTNSFNAWRFLDPELEALYQTEIHERLIRRTPAVMVIAFTCIIVFGAVDYYFLPRSVGNLSILLRCISMGFLGYNYYCSIHYGNNAKKLMRSYVLTYLSSGLVIIGIVWASQKAQLFLPYDGLFIVIMFGYFLLGLTFSHALIIGILLIFAYLIVDTLAGTASIYRVYNTLFLISGNAIGAVGYYYFDQTQRTAFIRGQLIAHAKLIAEENNQRTTRFLAVASHDLRQPIQALRLAAENWIKKQNINSTSSYQNIYPLIEHINTLVTGFFDISKSQYGALTVENSQFPVKPFIEHFVETVRPLFNSTHVQLEVSPISDETWIETDAMLLDRVFRNLLHNALTHAKASKISLFFEPLEAHARLGIKDDGIGLPLQKREALFLEFQREGNSDGLGLGLAIVRELTDQMNLTLGFSSTETEGSRFWLDIPCVLKPPQQKGIPQTTLKNCKILVIDDAEEVRHHHAAVFARAGAEVETAALFTQAMESINHFIPNLIVCDYHLSAHENGIDLIRSIRETIGFVPAILATADERELIRLQAEQNQIIYAAKPLTPIKLILLAEQLLKSTR